MRGEIEFSCQINLSQHQKWCGKLLVRIKLVKAIFLHMIPNGNLFLVSSSW